MHLTNTVGAPDQPGISTTLTLPAGLDIVSNTVGVVCTVDGASDPFTMVTRNANVATFAGDMGATVSACDSTLAFIASAPGVYQGLCGHRLHQHHRAPP